MLMGLENYLSKSAITIDMAVIRLYKKRKVLVCSIVIAKEFMTKVVMLEQTIYIFVQLGLHIALKHLLLVFIRKVEVNREIAHLNVLLEQKV